MPQHADSAQNQANRMLRMAAQKVLHSLRDFQDDALALGDAASFLMSLRARRLSR
jgi:hypothetical protein